MGVRLRWLLVATVVLAAGCAGPGEVPEDRFYRLNPVAPEQPLAEPLLRGVLEVERLDAFGVYHDRAILYAPADEPATLLHHHYHFWVAPPTELVRDHLAAYLRAANLAETVASGQLGQRGDLVLAARLTRFERVLKPDGAVVTRVGLAVVARRDGQLALRREYAADTAAEDASFGASVRAIEQGLASVYAALLGDLQRLLRPR